VDEARIHLEHIAGTVLTIEDRRGRFCAANHDGIFGRTFRRQAERAGIRAGGEHDHVPRLRGVERCLQRGGVRHVDDAWVRWLAARHAARATLQRERLIEAVRIDGVKLDFVARVWPQIEDGSGELCDNRATDDDFGTHAKQRQAVAVARLPLSAITNLHPSVAVIVVADPKLNAHGDQRWTIESCFEDG